jgi:hypothetical protein
MRFGFFNYCHLLFIVTVTGCFTSTDMLKLAHQGLQRRKLLPQLINSRILDRSSRRV